MKPWTIAVVVLALVATGGYTVLAGGKFGRSCASSAQAKAGACSSDPSAASCEAPQGKIAGHFDPAMSGVCRFACATKLNYQTADVMGQPGARPEKLTQCPVSGVVFAVEDYRPRVRIAGEDYVTCCDKCASKLKRDPRHYLKS